MSASHSRDKDLPVGWSVSPLEDVADILDGKRVPINAKERETRTGQVPYYGATGQVGWIDNHLFDEELVLLGEDGAPFLDPSKPKAYVIRGKSWVNNHAHILRTKDGTPNAYLKYFLDRFDYHGFVTGTTRLKLTQGAMRQIPIPLPSPEDRRRIVAEIEKQFSRLDEAVANLQRVRANLKRYKAAVLKAAVEGKLTEEWRQQHLDVEPASKLLERILDEQLAFRKSVKWKEAQPINADELRSLPKSWTWARLHYLGSLENGDRSKNYPSRSAFVGQGIPFINAGHIVSGSVDMSRMNFITEDRFRLLRAGKVRENDLLFCLRGSLGKVAIVRNIERGAIASSLVIVRTIKEVHQKFLLYYLQSPLAHQQIGIYDNGSAQPNLSASDLGKFLVPLPSHFEQQQIVAEVERRLSVIEELETTVEANLTRAGHLRQSVLGHAFSGKL